MNDQALSIVSRELSAALTGGLLKRVYQLGSLRFAVSFDALDERPLLIAAEPARPRLYLIRRRTRDLEKAQTNPNHFVLLLRKHLAGARLDRIEKDTEDRILRFRFNGHDEAGAPLIRTLVAQLTGRSANLFLLDADSRILDRLRSSHGAGQDIAEEYQAPARASGDKRLNTSIALPPPSPRPACQDELTERLLSTNSSPSDILEEHDIKLDAQARFNARANAELARLRRELQKRTKLHANLRDDLAVHGNPDAHKRCGDLLLANLATATRDAGRVRVTDYFADDAPTIEIEVDENKTLQEAAARFFTRYAKAKRAGEELDARLAALERETEFLTNSLAHLESIIAERDDAALDALLGADKKSESDRRTAQRPTAKRANPNRPAADRRPTPNDHIPGTRRYRSSDSFEIVVGRGARENDQVTFRLARPNDLWLHAADYPGAHVVIRNHTRADIPHRTLVEAAQLAAFTSQAKADAKVSVNYTPRKFISKPKGAAPGLVRLAQFKTLLVEPREAGERIPT